MKTYLELLRTPGVARVMGSQLVARFPWGLVSMGFVLFFYARYHSYAIAGLALAAQTIGVGVSNPLLGRKLSQWGVFRVLAIGSTLSSALLLVLVLVPMHAWVAVTLAGLVGIISPPVQSASRLTFGILVSEKKVSTLFAFDAISQELIWIFGPILATFLVAFVDPAAPIIAMSIFQFVGTLWFLSNPEVKQIVLEKPGHRLGGVLRYRSLVWIIIIGTMLVAGFSGVEIGTVGALDKVSAGIAIGALSVGSMVGGVWFGHRTHSKYAMTWFTAIILVGYSLSLLGPDNTWWLGLCWFIAGMGVAPALGLLNFFISKALPASSSSEAYGWLGAGQLGGYSMGAAITGVALDVYDPTMAFVIATGFGLATLLASFFAISSLPKLKNESETK